MKNLQTEKENEMEQNQEKLSRRNVIGKISGLLKNRLSTGELANLRRASPEEPYTPALWKVLFECVPESWTAGANRDLKERRWAALLMSMAACPNLHDPTVSVGEALAEAGWSELRFVRLMKFKDKDLFLAMRRLAAYLVSKNQAANWTDLADLILDQNGPWAEKHRRRISRDYYSKLYRIENQN